VSADLAASDPSIRDPSARAELPRAWTFEAREMGKFALAKTPRPWNWIELDQAEAEVVWRLLGDFVAFVNRRYVERVEQTIPPCWAEHGALVEELTTLCWARWHAFEGEEGTVGGAQFWHSYTLPMFLERMGRWLGPDRLVKCQNGKHEDRVVEDPLAAVEWEARTATIERLDVELRRPPRRPPAPGGPPPSPPAGADESASGNGATPTLRVLGEATASE